MATRDPADHYRRSFAERRGVTTSGAGHGPNPRQWRGAARNPSKTWKVDDHSGARANRGIAPRLADQLEFPAHAYPANCGV